VLPVLVSIERGYKNDSNTETWNNVWLNQFEETKVVGVQLGDKGGEESMLISCTGIDHFAF